MAKPWGGAGAWAAEAEQAEADAKALGAIALPTESFPSLVESIAAKPKKKKGTTLSISEFTTGKYVGPGGKNRQISESSRLTTEEMMSLPTAPRDRSNEEAEIGGLGGGFRDYGGNRGGGERLGFGDRSGGDREPRERGFGGGFERERDDRRGRDREPRDDGPSRADGADNWSVSKKAPLPSSYIGSGRGGGQDDDRTERGTRLSDRDMPSRADEDDNWGVSKKFVPSSSSEGTGERRGGRSGGYEERRTGYDDRRSGLDLPGAISRADEASNWGAAKKSMPTTALPERRVTPGFNSAYRDSGANADRWAKRDAPVARDDSARPSERPRLILQGRTLPIDPAVHLPPRANSDAGSEGGRSRPGTPQTLPRSRPGTPQTVSKSRPGTPQTVL